MLIATGNNCWVCVHRRSPIGAKMIALLTLIAKTHACVAPTRWSIASCILANVIVADLRQKLWHNFKKLRRNFLMNPRSGLKIRPFKQAHLNRATDVELLKLSQYLRAIVKVPDFSTLDHRKWERYLRLR